MKKIVFTGGGTLGHVVPNLNIIERLKGLPISVSYIGRNGGIEKDVVLSRKIKYYGIPAVKLQRKLSFELFLMPIKLIRAVRCSKKLLSEIKPDLVFSKGGYVSLPVCLASKILHIPYIVHESDLSVGLANKLTVKHAKYFLTAFPKTCEKYKNGKFVGMPLKNYSPCFSKDEIKESLGITTKKTILLVFGGSQGSDFINKLVLSSINDLTQNYFVLHITGKGKLSNTKKDGYKEIEFYNGLSDLYFISDAVLSRGGSTSLFEILSFNLPSIIIPLQKNSRGDQVENAKYFSDNGLIQTLLEKDANSSTLIFALKNLEINRNETVEKIKKCNFQEATKKTVSYILNELK